MGSLSGSGSGPHFHCANRFFELEVRIVKDGVEEGREVVDRQPRNEPDHRFGQGGTVKLGQRPEDLRLFSPAALGQLFHELLMLCPPGL